MSLYQAICSLPGRTLQALALSVAAAGLVLVYAASAKPVRISLDGRVISIRTHARTVASALRDAGLTVRDGDEVRPGLEESLPSGAVIEVLRAHPILIEVGRSRRWVMGVGSVPANLLDEAGIKLYPGDRVWVDGLLINDPSAALPVPPTRVRVEPGLRLTVELNGTELQVWSAAPTLGEALWEQGFRLLQADEAQPQLGRAASEREGIEVTASQALTIAVDGTRVHSRAVAVTVGEALAETGVALVGLDYAIPDLGSSLPANGQIRVVRVREEVLVEQEPLPFDTEFIAVADLEIDQRTVLEPGAYGVLANRIRIRYEDGAEVSRTVEGDWVAREPVTRQLGYGTNIVIRTISTADGTLEYWRAIRMWATSYSPSRAGVSPSAPNFGITASGKPLTKGLVAIDRSLIPFGTLMYVEGYGFAEAADTGSGVRGRWIDLGYDDDNWVSWHQYVTVYFLTPVPPPLSIVWIFP